VPAWSQTQNTLCLPGVKPGILCFCLESNAVYSACWESNPIYSACLASNPVYSVPALVQALITRLPNTWYSHCTIWATGSLTVYLNLNCKNFSTIFPCPRKEMKLQCWTESGCKQTQPCCLWHSEGWGAPGMNTLTCCGVLHLFPLLCISGFHGLLGWIIS